MELTLTFVCGFVEDFIYDLTGEMIFELSFQTVVTLFRLVIGVLSKIGKNITLYVPRIRLVGIRQEECLKPSVNVAITASLY